MLKIFIPICIVIICINIVFFHIPICTTDISYIKIDSTHGFSTYNINEKELENPKIVTITCNIKNTSYIKTAYNIELTFVNAQDTSILPNNKIDSPEVDYLNLKPRESRRYRFNFIVDSKEYNETELLELLKGVKFTLTGYIYNLDNIDKGYLLDKEPRNVSVKEFNCELMDY